MGRKRFGLPFVSSIEPKEINLSQICKKQYPSRTWEDLAKVEQAALLRKELRPRTILIDPATSYMHKWDLVIMFCLLYTSLVTPFEVSFLGELVFENPLFWINRLIDTFFIKDMIMQFFLMVQVQGKRGTFWIRDRRKLTMMYLKGWFLIDFLSVFPLELVATVTGSSSVGSKAKVIRMIRLARLVKLMRILRVSRVTDRLQNHLSISYAAQTLVKLLVLCVITAHWIACFWGMIGLQLGTDFKGCKKNSEGEMVPEFVHTEDLSGMSWIVALFNEDLDSAKGTPDNPCDPICLYVTSLHWSVMTLTSIGYGDIVPVRSEEYWVCILCMFIAGFSWAYLIGSACGALANLDPQQVWFENNMDALNYMVKQQEVSKGLKWRLRDYFREGQHLQRMRTYKDLYDRMSSQLRGEVLLQMTCRAVKLVSYFYQAPNKFIIELAEDMELNLFAVRERFPTGGKLYILERGLAASGGRVYAVGATWGEDMVVNDPLLQDQTAVIAMTFCETLVLLKNDLFKVLENWPVQSQMVRKAALRFALRAVCRLHQEQTFGRKQSSKSFMQVLKQINNIRCSVSSAADYSGVKTGSRLSTTSLGGYQSLFGFVSEKGEEPKKSKESTVSSEEAPKPPPPPPSSDRPQPPSCDPNVTQPRTPRAEPLELPIGSSSSAGSSHPPSFQGPSQSTVVGGKTPGCSPYAQSVSTIEMDATPSTTRQDASPITTRQSVEGSGVLSDKNSLDVQTHIANIEQRLSEVTNVLLTVVTNQQKLEKALPQELLMSLLAGQQRIERLNGSASGTTAPSAPARGRSQASMQSRSARIPGDQDTSPRIPRTSDQEPGDEEAHNELR